MDAAFGDHQVVAGDLLGELQGGVQAGVEGVQVAVVDADQLDVELQRPGQFVGGVHFHQHVTADPLGGVVELVELGVGQRRHDQQHRVGAHGAGFEHLPRVDDEVLAQQRQGDRVAGGAQVVLVALEEVLVGEHGQGAGAGPFVTAGDVHRVEVLADQPLAGGGFLDLGDHRRPAGGHAGVQRFGEAPGLALVVRHGFQFAQAVALLAGLDLLALALDDALQNGSADGCVAHTSSFNAKVNCASSRMRSAASPLWTRSSAIRTPSSRVRVTPDT